MPGGQGDLGSLASAIKDAVNELLKNSGIDGIGDVRLDTSTCKVEEVLGDCKEKFDKALEAIDRIIELRGRIRELEGEAGGEEDKDKRRKELEKLKNELKKLEESVEDFAGCQGARIVLGEYDCKSSSVTIYLKCFELAECKTRSFLARMLAETLAHELIHHLQFKAPQASLKLGGKEGFSVLVDLRGKCGGALYGEVPYPYRPHEAEAFEKQNDLAGKLLGWDKLKKSKLKRSLNNVAEKTLGLLGVG